MNNGTASSDLDLQSISVSGNVIALNGTIVTPEEESSSENPFPILATVSDEVPSSLSLPAGDLYGFPFLDCFSDLIWAFPFWEIVFRDFFRCIEPIWRTSQAKVLLKSLWQVEDERR